MIEISINLKDIDVSFMKSIPKDMALKMKIISFKEEHGKIYFYTNKKDENKKVYLSLIFNKDIEFIEIQEDKVISIIISCYGDELVSINEDNFIEKQFRGLINNAIETETSDIHIEPQSKWVNIRFRIDGVLNLINRIQLEEYNSLINKIKLDGGMNISDKLKAQDGKITFTKSENKFYDLRISSLPTIYGEKIVIRILYKNEKFININNLNFNYTQREKLNKLLKLKHGMILVNGPTGSGKSTTLYALVNSINRDGLNISTIEDPVEFHMEGITQTNVNDKVGLNFYQGLKYILRQDPDVILVGEIRDEETAKMAVRASITGHKVYSTIHTNSGYEVYGRLLDMGAKEYLIKDALKGIITQRLVKTLCDSCKERINISTDEYNKFNLTRGSVAYKEKGCNLCSNTGYKGRTMICEVILIKNIDENNFINQNFGEEILNSCLELVKKGRVSINEYIVLWEGEMIND